MGKHEVADLAGFLDGFQARNMAAIERSVSVPLSELQTRLQLLRSTLPDSANQQIPTLISSAGSALRDGAGSIVSRIVATGEVLNKLILEHGPELHSSRNSWEQLSWIVQRFGEASQAVNQEKTDRIALSIAEAYQNIGKNP